MHFQHLPTVPYPWRRPFAHQSLRRRWKPRRGQTVDVRCQHGSTVHFTFLVFKQYMTVVWRVCDLLQLQWFGESNALPSQFRVQKHLELRVVRRWLLSVGQPAHKLLCLVGFQLDSLYVCLSTFVLLLENVPDVKELLDLLLLIGPSFLNVKWLH